MAGMAAGKSDHWGSRFGFIMAAVGSSVGLGNLWRFPYTAGEEGGSAFILIYLLCVVFLGLPVLMAEYAVGRRGQRSAIAGIRYITKEEGKPGAWVAMGWIGAIASLLIFSFYIVISAWVFSYIPIAFSGDFAQFSPDAELLNANIGASIDGLKDQISSVRLSEACAFVDGGLISRVPDVDADGNDILRDILAADVSGCRFAETTSNKPLILGFLAAFLALNVVIVARGVHDGIERAVQILMPLFFIMLLGMVIYNLIIGDGARAAEFLFKPNFNAVDGETWLAAAGQAFFSIGLGSCLMITYGAYLTRETNIPRSSVLIATSDTFVALIAGLAIFPIVFAAGLSAAAGGGLLFVSMPIAFGGLPVIVGGLFFTLALFAAYTSSISLFEVGVSWLEDQPAIGRTKGAIGLGFVMFAMAVGYVYRGEFIDHVDFVTGNLMLPLGGLLISLFAGWVLPKTSLADEVGEGVVLSFIRIMLRFVVPIALFIILFMGIYSNLVE